MAKYRKRISRYHVISCLDYRVPMRVDELYVFNNRNGYYACPRCHNTLEREFSNYCDRCGQCLNWSHYRSAKRIYLG